MANATNHIVKIWRGKRITYDTLLKNNNVDYWTHYYVKEASGLWTEYFGAIPVRQETGQLYPVDTIVNSLPSNLTPGERYLVGHDATDTLDAEYYVVEIAPEIIKSIITPLGSLSVRVKDRDLYSYQIVDGVLTTYDGDIFGGTF